MRKQTICHSGVEVVVGGNGSKWVVSCNRNLFIFVFVNQRYGG